MIGGIPIALFFLRKAFCGRKKNVQGDITQILDTDGSIVVKYVYDAWGNHVCISADGTKIYDSVDGVVAGYESHVGVLNPFRYRSYFYDVETGLYFLQSRYYDPQIGRFISQDDVSYINAESINGLNLYAYCGSNPVMRIDPNGTKWWHWVLGGLAVIGMVALTIVTCGVAVAIAAGVAGAIAGGIYGGMTAAANGQNIWVGIGVGALAGAFMGMGAAVGGAFIVPALSGAATFGGLSVGASLVAGAGIAFTTGFAGGFLGDAMIQANNGDGKVNWGAAAWSGLQWGVLNTINTFACGVAGNLTGFGANFALGLVANFMYGSIGLLIDVLRGRKSKPKSTIGIQANISSGKYFMFG